MEVHQYSQMMKTEIPFAPSLKQSPLVLKSLSSTFHNLNKKSDCKSLLTIHII